MLTVQFGQCGNQNGFEKWFKGVSKSGTHLARAILLDTEQKVINKICSEHENTSASWAYSPQNIVCHAGGGSANNWAYGYSVKGPQLGEAALEVARQEIEKMDSFEGILSILSSAGGTGSGVGSHVMEQIRDEFRTKTIASAIVLPYASGDVCTQNYNTMLTLAKFIEVTDLVLIFENDQIHSICENLIKVQNTNLNDLNQVIGCKLAAVFQPIFNTSNILASVVHQITPHPQYKIAAIKTSPIVLPSLLLHSAGYKWLSVVRHLKQMLRAPSLDLELVDAETRTPPISVPSRTTFVYSKSVSNMLFTRGSSVDNDQIVVTELTDKKLYPDWVPRFNKISHLHQPRKLVSRDKFAALVTNNSLLYRPVNTVVEKAWNSYIHSAFLHQYKQHGISEDDFLQTFAKIENVVKAYKDLNNEAMDS